MATSYGHEKHNELEYGLPIANPNEFANDMWWMEKKETIDQQSCKDVFSGAIPNTESVTGIVLNGETLTLASPVAVTSPNDVRDAIVTALNTREFRIDADFSYDGTNATFHHIGKWAVSSIITDANTYATVRLCTRVTLCQYITPVDGALGDLTYNNGAAQTFASTYDYADGQSDADALKTDVENALTAAGATNFTVETSLNNEIMAIDLVIYATRGSVIRIGTARLNEERCKIEYV